MPATEMPVPLANERPEYGLRIYTAIWFFATAVLGHDYLVLNHKMKGATVLGFLHRHGLLAPGQKLLPEAGAAISYRFGWLGFAVICMTNLYILRKRFGGQGSLGSMRSWLDFHIFCGLIGPTFIVFHTNFRVGGLVAISFWSMMISFGSGVVGRYLYTQMLRQRAELKLGLAYYEDGFKHVLSYGRDKLDSRLLMGLKDRAYAMAGGTDAMTAGTASLLEVLGATIIGDLTMLFRSPVTPTGVPELRQPLKEYAVARRRLATASYFRKLMGYWHAFHMPFAVFMYVVSVIHIFAELVFRTHH